ncbi:hypothetical protein ACFO5R_13410 [Halosolutus amylolyticus]|uniref:Uncharacterized protein n=1 Tax=Halosolutus amylolyticus TaxID=2932267 RepID=A0ABD5PQT2_9EURY|nr:hypothetical protein [Halosolutus amylolyticus]
MASDRHSLALVVLLGSAALVTLVVHLSILPRYYPDDPFTTGLVLLAGWTTFALVFYAAGRLRAGPATMPSMRIGDVGLALFLLSVLFALALDSFGFTPELIGAAYVLPGIGAYAGLALLGWAIGQRTAAINRIAADAGD